MNATTTALPRKSASAKGLPSCEVNVNCGAGPITGNSRLPSPPYAESAVEKTSSANAKNAANLPAFPLLAGEFAGKHRIGPNLIRDNTIYINALQHIADYYRTPRQGNFDQIVTPQNRKLPGWS